MKASHFLRVRLADALTPIVVILIGLLIGCIPIIIAGENPLPTYAQLFYGAFGNMDNLASTLVRSIPVAITGVGVSVTAKSGLFNMGGPGQLLLGAITAAAVGAAINLPRALSIPLVLLSGIIGGMLGALLPAVLESKFRMNVLVVTLLFNYVISLFVTFMVNYRLRDTTVAGLAQETRPISDAARLTRIVPGTRLHTGIFIALAVVLVASFFLKKSVLGYELRMSGFNPVFAEYGGLNRAKIVLVAMLISGALAGLAGSIEVCGVYHRFVVDTLDEHAWTGITASLLGNANPVGVLIAAVLVSALNTGALGLTRTTNVPIEIASIVQAVIVLFIASRLGVQSWLLGLERRHKERAQ